MKNRQEIKVRQYVMVIEEESEGGFSGTFPDVPGCFTQGDTMEKLLVNAEDALETHFAGRPRTLISWRFFISTPLA